MTNQWPTDKELIPLDDDHSVEDEIDATELRHISELVNTLVKTIKTIRYYPPENPMVTAFKGDLVKHFNQFLRQYPAFTLQIAESEFLRGKHVLHQNADLKTSVPFLLYNAGLREIRFMQGIEEWEILSFIDVINQAGNVNPLEDDLVTMLWEKEFTHFEYSAIDDFLESDSASVPVDIDEFRNRVSMTALAPHVEADHWQEQIAELPEEDREEPGHSNAEEESFTLTEEEVQALQTEVDAEFSPTFIFGLADIIFEIFTVETRQEPYRDAVEVLVRMLDAMLAIDGYDLAAPLLRRLYAMQTDSSMQAWQVMALRQAALSMGEPARIERLGQVLAAQQDMSRLESLRQYLLLLQPNAVPPLIHVLEQLHNARARGMLCDVLVEIGRNAIDQFGAFLDHHQWYVVRNITYILGRLKHERTSPLLAKAAEHTDARVRREAVQALATLGGQRAMRVLSNALSDTDEVVRSIAAFNLGKIRTPAAVSALLEQVTAKTFLRKDATEMKAFFDGLGASGSSDAVHVLQRLLAHKSWFSHGERVENMRLGAARALLMIGTPEALAILESGKKAKDPDIRAACLQAGELSASGGTP